jgi:hypothetical protein
LCLILAGIGTVMRFLMLYRGLSILIAAFSAVIAASRVENFSMVTFAI